MILCACLLSAASARAQWVVYELSFEADEDSSVNFQFYTGAYVVAPLNGGVASILLTTEPFAPTVTLTWGRRRQ